MSNYNKTQIKQLIFKVETEYDMKADELSDTVNKLYPKGQKVKVTKGRGSWYGTISGGAWGHNHRLVVEHNKSKKVHHVSHNDLERA